MKLLVFILASVALSNAAPASTSLVDSLQFFLDLFQWDKVKAVVMKHLENDPALAEVVSHLQGAEWHNATQRISGLPGIQDLVKYLVDAGIPVGDIFQGFEDGIMEARSGVPPAVESLGLYPFLGDVEEHFNFEGMYWFYNGRLMEDPFLQRLFVKVTGEDAKETADEVLNDPEVKRFQRRLIYLGFRIDMFFKCVYERNGWGRPPGDEATPADEAILRSFFPVPCTFTFFYYGRK